MNDKYRCPLCKAPVEEVTAKTDDGREFKQLIYTGEDEELLEKIKKLIEEYEE